MIDAVVFDMDGVLIDAREWHYEALNRALSMFGFTIGRSEHLTLFDGLPTRRKLEMLSEMHGLPVGLHSVLSVLKQQFTEEFVVTRCHPVFRHRRALAVLQDRGIRLGVASNSVRRSVDLMMERAGLAPMLEVILSNEDVDNAKPSPDIYLEAMQRLGSSPSTTLVVEDNAHGVEAARAAGAHVLEVAGPHEVTIENILAVIDGTTP
jgi:beta-phosphoglucomutase